MTSAEGTGDPGAAELRVYLLVRDLQPQFAAYLGTPVRARGYPPFAGQHALIVEQDEITGVLTAVAGREHIAAGQDH